VDRLAEVYGAIDPRSLRTGVLYDRVLPLSGIEHFDGRPGAPARSLRAWRQVYDELRRAGPSPERPAPEAVVDRGRSRRDAIPITLLFDRYERLRRDAIERGAVEVREGRLHLVEGTDALERHTAFAVAPLRTETWRGGDLRFVLDRADFFSNAGTALDPLEIDFDDGLGFRRARFGATLAVRYRTTGVKTIRVRAHVGGEAFEAASTFAVRGLVAPLPDDTLHVTGTIPYLGAVAAGDAYVYRAPGHGAIVNPVVVVEGFDLDNTMNWDELYALLNQEGLIETLRAEGYDAVVLNFADATDYIQRNGLLLVQLLQEVQAIVGPPTTIALVGASMGGLAGRYALAYMESNAIPHSVRTYLSFDTPHLGADIPLGIQYWVRFFSGQSTEAAFLLSRLDRPAARQMLVYHYTNPPGPTGEPDPLRATFLADLAAAGDWPLGVRKVAIANGSGTTLGQGFAEGAQLVQWSYGDFFVSLLGNVWAVPSLSSRVIFDGRIRILFSDTRQTVTVSGTQPYDNAPGGWRATMTQMDEVSAPYGDIVALHPAHCFIPTVSALAFETSDLFHDVAGDPDPLAHTPFDVVYAPAMNQEHVTITPESADWIRSEIQTGVTGVEPPSPGATAAVRVGRPTPNPSSDPVRIALTLPRAATVDIRVLGVDGREVARLAAGDRPAGAHSVEWSGLDDRGSRAPAGVYFVRIAAEGRIQTRRLVRLF
jgi:hypothetical protein